MDSLTSKKDWNLRLLLLCHMLGALLLASFFWPWTRAFWDGLDVIVFKALNSTLKSHPSWQLFWACANHKWADWIEDLCVLCFFVAHVKSAKRQQRPRKIIELIFCVLWIAAILYFVNRVLFRETLKIPRPSPTLLIPDSISLSQEIPWMSIKDSCAKSFPGDHGTTALLFSATFSYLAHWRLGLLACFYALFLCLPRLITGAHWLSDIVVGSGSIALICLSWAFCSPLFIRFTERCVSLFCKTSAKTLPEP